jgi:hypothetical protein
MTAIRVEVSSFSGMVVQKAFEAGATIAPRPLQSAQPRSLEWSRASLREVVSGAAGNSGKAI